MARRIPENRFAEVIAAATNVFIARGYRRTQMSDIAAAVGVAKGTLYGYVESKDALLALCLIHADPGIAIPTPEKLPVAAWPKGMIAKTIIERTAEESVGAEISAALARDRAEDPRAEFEAVVREFYGVLHRNRWVIKLIEKCPDHPELLEAWQSAGRDATRIRMERYVESRVRAGQFRRVLDIPLAARMITEVCTTWAVHIHWDPIPQKFDPEAGRENAIDFLVHAYFGEVKSG